MTVERVVHPGQPCSGDDYKTSVGKRFRPGDWVLHATRGLGEVTNTPMPAGTEGKAAFVRFEGTSSEAAVACVELQPGKAPHAGERDHWQRLIQMQQLPDDAPYLPSKAKEGYYSKALKRAISRPHDAAPVGADPSRKSGGSPPAPVTFEDRWQELEEHAAVVACSDWPVMKAVASLASKAGDLEVNRLTGRNLEQLLEQAHRAVRAKAEPITGGGTFKVKATPWAVDGLFRHGLNLLVGQSGAGKSRLVAACMAAWLRGDQTWLNLPLNGIEPKNRHALIVGSDQTLEDWAITLEPVGLCKRLDGETVQIHPNLTLYGLETAVGLDADGLAIIRRWVDHNPGGMVLVDSLSSCLPPGIDEATKAAGRPVRQLQEALGDAWGILTHHTRKGAGKEGNLGVGAGRGSGDIDAAVSRVVGLGLIYKMENGQMVAQESDPRRELLSSKRGGKTLHLVVRSDASGFWSNEGDAEALKQQERQERAISNLTEAQGDVWALLDAADGWMTLRALMEGAGEEYEAKGAKAATTRKVLKRLEVLGLVESTKSGNERTYRTKGEPLRGEKRELISSLGSPTAPQGFSMAHPLAHTGSPPASEPPTASEPSERLTPASEPQGEPVKSQSLQQVSQVSHLPLFVAQPSGSPAALIPLGAAVEHLGLSGAWRHGWKVADVVDVSTGTRYRISRDGESLNVAADQIQLHPEAA
jgi:hypothetical protein